MGQIFESSKREVSSQIRKVAFLLFKKVELSENSIIYFQNDVQNNFYYFVAKGLIEMYY